MKNTLFLLRMYFKSYWQRKEYKIILLKNISMEMSAKTKEDDLDLYESIVKLVAQTKKHVKAFLYNHKEL